MLKAVFTAQGKVCLSLQDVVQVEWLMVNGEWFLQQPDQIGDCSVNCYHLLGTVGQVHPSLHSQRKPLGLKINRLFTLAIL